MSLKKHRIENTVYAEFKLSSKRIFSPNLEQFSVQATFVLGLNNIMINERNIRSTCETASCGLITKNGALGQRILLQLNSLLYLFQQYPHTHRLFIYFFSITEICVS
ncbi:hypothetical protein GOODEAATRI_025706 [Goodea atripinnis]|uniref:Uncharacterized protein n=1 Tax=Goodea atripinnis TaxID=208336 RepID=A0ABV0MV33_9TELE